MGGCTHSCVWITESVIDCTYSSHIPLKDVSVKPENRTPLDRLGFPQRFCWCCSLRLASIVVCLISFLYASVVLVLSDRTLAVIYPERGVYFKYSKTAYQLTSVVFLLACVVLLVGVTVRKEKFMLVFIWCALFFNCMVMAFTLGGLAAVILRQGAVGARQVTKTVLCMMWCSIYFYLLMVVNSYRLAVWQRTLELEN